MGSTGGAFHDAILAVEAVSRSAHGLLFFLAPSISKKFAHSTVGAVRSLGPIKMEDQSNRAHRKTKEKKKHSGGRFRSWSSTSKHTDCV